VILLVALRADAQMFVGRFGTKLVLGNTGDTTLTLRAPATGLQSYTLTLPALAPPTGRTFVTTNGSGALDWISLSGSNTGDVTLAGSANYLTILGQVITRNAIDLSNANNITNALRIVNGGTNSAAALSGTARPVVTTASAIVENNTTISDNTLPKWSGGNFANSSITDNGTTVTTTENVAVVGAKTLQIGTASGTGSGTGSLALANSASSNLTTLQAGNATSAITYQLPTANGTSGQVLATDGNNPAQLSWTTPAGTGSAYSYAVRSIFNAQANVGSTSNTAVDAPGLRFPVAAGEVWSFSFDLSAYSSNGNGMIVGLKFPTGAVVEAQAEGLIDYGATGHTGSYRIMTSGSLVNALNPFLAEAGAYASIWIHGTIDNASGVAGNVQLQLASPASGDVGTKMILKNSFVIAWKQTAHTTSTQTYTSSTTWVVPSGVTSIEVSGVGGAGGGGGGGAKLYTSNKGGGSGGGGGASEYIASRSLSVVSGETLTFTIGAGGTAGSGGTTSPSAPTAGGGGGNTTISGSISGTIFTSNGGSGGTAGANSTASANGAGGSGGAGGSAVSTPPGTAGNSGTDGSNGTTSVVSGGAGGDGPTGGNANTAGSGGSGFGNSGATTGNGGNGAAGTSGYLTISY